MRINRVDYFPPVWNLFFSEQRSIKYNCWLFLNSKLISLNFIGCFTLDCPGRRYVLHYNTIPLSPLPQSSPLLVIFGTSFVPTRARLPLPGRSRMFVNSLILLTNLPKNTNELTVPSFEIDATWAYTFGKGVSMRWCLLFTNPWFKKGIDILISKKIAFQYTTQ